MALATIAAGISIASGISGFLGGRKAKDKTKKITRANLRLHEATTTQNIMQMQKRADQAMGEGRGRAYASGLMMTGSTKNYLNAMDAELTNEMDWFKRESELRREVIKRGGQAQASQASSMGFQSLLTGVSSGLSMLGD